ncbi:hypothetical protein ABB30_05305 [Stenotrophomonas ginsengisoli]|uniref:inorganic diphosphatase n=2 Tax=Stenotrophomonas ginsengisoli TaxID=336566 RepID=A0A0R0D8R7_9GAMM|nr:hypothetical protein ABB30_05305 [Stenotrophomonas ginsengisoli]
MAGSAGTAVAGTGTAQTDAAQADPGIWMQVEIPAGSRIKYEIDAQGRLFVDRFLPGAESYPANYGGLPGTVAGDGDPLDALLVTREPLPAGVRIAVRPIGLLRMRDGGQADDKLIAVPAAGVDADYAQWQDLADLPPGLRLRIKAFFAGYKSTTCTAECGVAAGTVNPVQLRGWGGAAEAMQLFRQVQQRAGQ